MPRNPGAKKNQHNHKHENGLVGPGKRITRQRSNGQINASPRGAHPDTPPLTPVTSHSLLNANADLDTNDSQSDAKQEGPGDPRKNGFRARDSESSYDGHDFDASGDLRQKHSEEGVLRKHEHTSTKSKASPDVTSLHLAATILKSCPAYDTIALLILLLQLPTIFLILVEALFASLTFMPPAGITFGSMFSLFDVFQGSAGAPSLGTMVFVDAICFGLWFCLWAWAQNFALDLAQVQVAITLGGGGPEKSSGVNGICLGLVLLLHLVRSKGIRQFFFNYFFPPRLLSNQRMAHFTALLPRESDFGTGPSPPSLVHSLLAVHIITQALMAFVRRRVASSQGSSSAKGTKRTDPEAAAGSPPVADAPTAETGVPGALAASSDAQSPPTPGLKDLRDKSISAKKRRRQANQIRSRQPFWAALASTKVTVIREYEHSRGSTKAGGRPVEEGAESNAGDEVVWITHVDPSTIEFEASNLLPSDEDRRHVAMCEKPFYVRINGARWHSLSASCSKEDDSKADAAGRWTGELSGLAPNCTYTCTFVRTEDDEEFACITVKTPALTDRDYPSSLAASPLRQHPGPSSPTTTIKNSIQNAEAKLNEARNRLTKSRRAHKAALSKVEKEVESYNTRLKSSSDDNKQRQKLLQAQNNIRQNEDATVSIAAALENLSVIPEDEVADHSSRKDAFQRQRELLDTAISSKESARLDGESEVSGVTSELNSIVARRERLTARQARLAEQFDRITQANIQGMNEKERKAAESMAKEADQARFEEHYHTQFNLINNEIQSLQRRTSQAWHEIHVFEQQASAQESMMKNGGQLTPDGNVPGLNPSHPLNSRSFGFGFPNASMQPPTTMSPELGNGSPFLAYAKTLPPDNNNNNNNNTYYYRRPRSTSNRSGGAVSNFSADFEDADPIPPMPAGKDFEVNALMGRKDSGSSRGHNNGSPGAMAMGGLGSPMKGRGSPGHGIW